MAGPAATRPRQTLRLDLTGDVPLNEQQEQVDLLLKVLSKKKKIVVIAGAGISVSAGSKFVSLAPVGSYAILQFLVHPSVTCMIPSGFLIPSTCAAVNHLLLTHFPVPDFRSSTGLFKTLRSQYNLKYSGRDLFDASVYKQKASTTSFHHMVSEMSTQIKNVQPTPFHHMIASLAQQGRLLRLYTQNVDSIDSNMEPLATKIPLRAPWPKTVQLHGSLEKAVCVKCHTLSDFDPSIFSGPTPPPCKQCYDQDFARTTVAGKRSHGVGHLRPRMVLYNETGPDELSIGAVSASDLRARPDALIVVGTTLKVPGTRRLAKEMASVVQGRRDGVTIWLNYDREPSGNGLDRCWDLVVKGPCDAVAEIASLPPWDAIASPVDEGSSSAVLKGPEPYVLTVALPTAPRLSPRIMTPTSSPERKVKNMEVEHTDAVPLSLVTAAKPDKVTKGRTKKAGAGPKQPRKRARATKAPALPSSTKITNAFSLSKSGQKLASSVKTIDDTIQKVDGVENESGSSETPRQTRPARARKSDISMALPGMSEFCLSSPPTMAAATPLPVAPFTSAMDASTKITWANPISGLDMDALDANHEHVVTLQPDLALEMAA